MLVGSQLALSEEEAEEAEEEKVAGRACTNKRNFNSFDAIDDHHVYIKASGNNHYLFTMQRKCLGLRSTHTIAVRDTLSRVCCNSFGRVIYPDMSRGLLSCHIRNIEVVESEDSATGLVEDRRAEKQHKPLENK